MVRNPTASQDQIYQALYCQDNGKDAQILLRQLSHLDIHVSPKEPRNFVRAIERLLDNPEASLLCGLPKQTISEFRAELLLADHRLEKLGLRLMAPSKGTKRQSPYAKSNKGNELAHFLSTTVPDQFAVHGRRVRLLFLGKAFAGSKNVHLSLRELADSLRLGISVGNTRGRATVLAQVSPTEPVEQFIGSLSKAANDHGRSAQTKPVRDFAEALAVILPDAANTDPSKGVGTVSPVPTKGRKASRDPRYTPEVSPITPQDIPIGELITTSHPRCEVPPGEIPEPISYQLFMPGDDQTLDSKEDVQAAKQTSRYWSQKARMHTRLSSDVHSAFDNWRFLSYLNGEIEFNPSQCIERRLIISLSYFGGVSIDTLASWRYAEDGNITPSGDIRLDAPPPDGAFAPDENQAESFIPPVEYVYVELPEIVKKMLKSVSINQGSELKTILPCDWEEFLDDVGACFDWLRRDGVYELGISQYTVSNALRATIQDLYENSVLTHAMTQKANEAATATGSYMSPRDIDFQIVYRKACEKLLSEEEF